MVSKIIFIKCRGWYREILAYGVRTSATNYGRLNDDVGITPTDEPLYDNEQSYLILINLTDRC